MLVRLFEDDEWDVRAAVAARVETPPSALSALSLDEEIEVLTAVADNPRLPSEAVAALSERACLPENEDPDHLQAWNPLRESLAEHAALPAAAARLLLEHADFHVAVALASNSHVPVDVLRGLADWGPRVADALLQNAMTPEDVVASLSDEDALMNRIDVASMELTSESELSGLVRDTHPRVRAAVASNESATQAHLAVLRNDADESVRWAAHRD